MQNIQKTNNKKLPPNRRKSMEVKIIINNGKIEIFEDEFKNSPLKSIFENSNIVVVERKRVSYIYPQNFILRAVFKALRKLLGDDGKIANWTRNWKCKWQVEILDENKSEKKIFKGFKDRKTAIKFEKDYIINQKTKKI
jgi:hypothetical protein